MKRWRHYWPALAGITVISALTAYVAGTSYVKNAGNLVYPTDDTFIHMAVAKNLAQHGVFGLTRYGFSSVSSSPLYTLILAATYAVTGISNCAPLFLNLIAAAAALVVVNWFACRQGGRPVYTLILILLLIHFTPLIPMVFLGMEHSLHVLLAVALGALFVTALQSPGKGNQILLCTTGFLATATRYESLFLIAPMCLVLLLYKRLRLALCLGVSAALPVVSYGIFSCAQGSYFLPNALLFKGSFPPALFNIVGWLQFLTNILPMLVEVTHMFVVVCVLLAVLLAVMIRKKRLGPAGWLCAIILVAALGHIRLAKIGWFYRYEAYLVALATVAAGIVLVELFQTDSPGTKDNKGAVLVTGLLAFVLFLPLNFRAQEAMQTAIPASRNIYQQQYQMGRFFRDCFPPGIRVAANDIGAINFLADIRCLDLMGLANVDVLTLRREHQFKDAAIARLLEKYDIQYIVIYTHWFAGSKSLPDNALKAGSWTIPDNVICAGDTVTFFATSPEAHDALVEQLHAFADKLPEEITQDLAPLAANPGQLIQEP